MAIRTCRIALALAVLLALASGAQAVETHHRLGFGGHYWTTVSDIDVEDVDDSGFSWIVSYQFRPPGLLSLEADLEIYPRELAGLDAVSYAPQAWALVGGTIYGGAGVGIIYADGRFADAPFYALRAGLDLLLLPSIYLDINANYRFEEWGNLNEIVGDISTDTVTIGATVRIEF